MKGLYMSIEASSDSQVLYFNEVMTAKGISKDVAMTAKCISKDVAMTADK